MKTSIIAGVSSFLLVVVLVCSTAAGQVEPFRSYGWAEDSEYVRVGKDFLERIPIDPVIITNFNSMQFVLAPEFVHACLLTPKEIERMNAALTNALHEYRTVQGQHFEPIDDEATFELAGKELPYARGTFAFSLKPFEAKARDIRERLKSEVLATLGAQRTKLFMEQGEKFLNGEMTTTSHARFAGQTHRFSVLTRVPGPLVDIKVTEEGGSYGRPYGEALDAYAPEKLKPILKRWRQWIAEQPLGSIAWTAPASKQTMIGSPSSLKLGKWSDASEYVDLPKAVLRVLRVPGLTDGQEISPEAATALGLSTNDVHAVNELYLRMKLRLEQLERGNVVRPNPKKSNYILRAFPKEADALREEWLTHLTELIGTRRAEFLDELIRNRFRLPYPRTHEELMRHRRDDWAGPRWFDRGRFEMRINIQKAAGVNGREGLKIRWESDRPESGEMGGNLSDLPEHLRHLLTPDMLAEPGSL